VYRPRGINDLQILFKKHFQCIAEQYERKHAVIYGRFRIERITEVVEKFILCGDYSKGVARIQCSNPDCKLEYFREQGLRLVEIARNASGCYRSQGQAERAALLRFLMAGLTLQGNRVVPAFKPPFDIIHRIAQEARTCDSGRRMREGTKKQAEEAPSACPTLLPQWE
jgi:hypothetical protein